MAEFHYVNGELVQVEQVEVTKDGKIRGLDAPYRVIRANVLLIGTQNGSVRLEEGASLTLAGIHNGSLHVANGCTAEINATHNGSVHIGAQGKVRVSGAQNGSVHIDPGGLFRVEPGGRHGGSVHNSGRYELAGERGGSMEGYGAYVEEPGSRVRQPTRFIGDSPIYEW